eukprot:CAMPEP_0114504148 /NCGR_PEP_ID=MMETSP0109-20121206/10048_1 /TAXON_ID=29199 /ORGANISM="Chlorarachnion reptans, Strain CCCM449" /LENGTH=860 /DNA_ID=CAMNT_0001682267 /DNA_START=363 /DNA_END=2945 /DNA_ORIENTATION=+
MKSLRRKIADPGDTDNIILERTGKEFDSLLGPIPPDLVVQVWQKYTLGRNRPVAETAIHLFYGATKPGRPVTHWWNVVALKPRRNRGSFTNSKRSSASVSISTTPRGALLEDSRRFSRNSRATRSGLATPTTEVIGQLRLRIRFDPGKSRVLLWRAECDTRLHRAFALALKRGMKGIVQRILGLDCLDINRSHTVWRRSALQLVAVQNSEDLVKLVLAAKADVAHEDSRGGNVFHTVARAGALKAAKTILEHMVGGSNESANENFSLMKAMVCSRDKDGRTPLHLCCMCNHSKMINLMLKYSGLDVGGGTAGRPTILDVRDNKDCTPLHTAAEFGSKETTKILITYKADTEVRDGVGLTPLHVAVRCSKLHTVEAIIEGKGCIDSVSPIGRSALFMAAEQGNPSIVKMLLMYSADFTRKDMLQKRVLDVATESQNELVTELLLIADPPNLVKSTASDDVQTPFSLGGSVARAQFQGKALMRASCEGKAETVQELLEAKADPNEEFLGFKPLHCAVWSKSSKAVELLLKHKADVGVKTPAKETLISLVLRRSDWSEEGILLSCNLIQILLRFNANPNEPMKPNEGFPLLLICSRKDTILHRGSGGNGERIDPTGKLASKMASTLIKFNATVDCRDRLDNTPLLLATRENYHDLVALLIRNKADPFYEQKRAGCRTALLSAAYFGHRRIIEIFIENVGKEGINRSNSQGLSALMMAATTGRFTITKLLLAAKAQVNTKTNTNGDTALMRAALRGASEVVALLLANRADVNLRSTKGDTALNWGIIGGSMPIVNALCSARADVNSRSTHGDHTATPLSVATKESKVDIVKRLLEYKAKPTSYDREIASKNGHSQMLTLLSTRK